MTNKYIELESKVGAHNYAPLPVVLTRGEGVYVWDDQGNRYLDMMSAYSAVSHGHCHPKLVEVLRQQAGQLNIVSRAFYTDKLGPFLQKLCEVTGYERALAMNTGVEAVETAVKAARKWAYKVKGVPKDQAEIIACNGNFHGRTISIVGLSTEAQYRDGFGPFPAGLKTIPFGDADALEKAITPNTAAFLVEPIQGEGGINMPPAGYLKKCEEICRKHNVLLICDEIQTGLGRTGKMLCYEHEGIKPDGVTLGKALGGGILPVSVFLTRNDVMNVFTPGDHGSTFGGNPLAASVGLAAINVLLEDGLIQNAVKMGEYFQESLRNLKSPLVKDVRGKGLLIGLEIDKRVPAHSLVLDLLKHGVLTKETHGTVIRLAPPLIITTEQVDVAVAAINAVLSQAVSSVA
ncbi:MAG TPA: ornithine--oxo-acid transaminase [Gammaproteobacteria bacterium]|jgi:ornithine--oxo-acid transaminase|nr:ornithine--oxo-acid transaminase [Gammaproteobacteria bacterium]